MTVALSALMMDAVPMRKGPPDTGMPYASVIVIWGLPSKEGLAVLAGVGRQPLGKEKLAVVGGRAPYAENENKSTLPYGSALSGSTISLLLPGSTTPTAGEVVTAGEYAPPTSAPPRFEPMTERMFVTLPVGSTVMASGRLKVSRYVTVTACPSTAIMRAESGDPVGAVALRPAYTWTVALMPLTNGAAIAAYDSAV